jgi:putative hydroxymethylpyrimidine transport system substrate-binding protein
MTKSRNLTWLAALAVAVVALSSCSDSKPATDHAGKPTTPLRVLLDWFPNPDHVGLYTAQSSNDFTDENLKVTLTPPSNASDPLKLIASGQASLGISYEPDTIIARSQGLHVTAVAALIPVALNSLIAPDTSPVKSPSQLANHTVGTAGLPADDVYLNQIYRKYGISKTPAKKVNVQSNLVAAMISKKVDATIDGYRNIEGVQLKDRGLNPLVVPVTDIGVPQYDELVVVANSDKLKNDASYRATVQHFLAGLAKGVATAVAHPEIAQKAMIKVAKGYSPELIKKMIDATTPLLRNPLGFGRMDAKNWQSFADWMKSQGEIKKPVDASQATTNAYLPS